MMNNKLFTSYLLLKKNGILKGSYYTLWIFLRKSFPIYTKNSKQPIYLRPYTSDFSVYRQIFLEDEYDTLFPENSLNIIDAGANVGLFSVYIKQKFPESNIVCIEPDKGNFECLAKNTNTFSKIHLEQKGLWSNVCKLKINQQPQGGEWAVTVEEDNVNGTISATSIDELMEIYQYKTIDILKMDIESSEKAVFTYNYENWLPKVKMLIIELHDWQNPGCSMAFFKAINKCLPDYSLSLKGENIIIYNNQLFNEQ